MTLVDRIIETRKELESPLSFWRWSAIVSISAVVKDNVWLNRQIYNLYPNVYVMLHAESGLKKGPPISLARKLVHGVNNTHIISGRSSIQGILKEMGTVKTLPGGKLSPNPSKVFICSSELSSSIVEDKVATTILTDLYDRQYNVGEWKSLLKMESFQLKNPTITMFTATNEAHSDDFFAKKDIQGGYFARTFIIYENKPNRSNSLNYPLLNPPNDVEAIEYLKVLSTLKGEFQSLGSRSSDEVFTELRIIDNKEVYFTKAGAVYEDWYNDFKKTIKESEIKDETGTLNRFGDSVLKVAMLLALAEKPELIISETAMLEAIQTCEKLIGNARKTTFGAKGLSNYAMLKARIINELMGRETHSISRALLMKHMWMHFGDPKELDDIMLAFNDAGLIKIESIGNQIIFKMPDDQYLEIKRFREGKLK